MGVLGARYLPHCPDPAFKTTLRASLGRYWDFVQRELQDERGKVYDAIGRSGEPRFYNYPWVAQLHLALYRATGQPVYLRRLVETCRAYYANGGERFYAIGLPIWEGLRVLERAGWKSEYEEMLAAFRKHADTILRVGTAYPKHEVNFEQSIVGPAAQILLEVHLATRRPVYLAGALQQLRLLELFNGRQPDHRLHEVALRHWDAYWFGQSRLYGDTLPHYWSTITGTVFARYALAAGDPSYARRAEDVFRNTFSLFAPDGRASCAYVYPLTINGQRGRFADAWANDQDWALVAWLDAQEDTGAAPTTSLTPVLADGGP
jgi:hypothetical protein